MSDTGLRATARKRARQAAAGRAPRALTGTALPFDRSLAHLCWQIGLSHERTAWVMGRSVGEVRHEWSVLTGLPLDDDPTEADVERITAEIRAGWSPEVFLEVYGPPAVEPVTEGIPLDLLVLDPTDME
jgi:hypothetical protein